MALSLLQGYDSDSDNSSDDDITVTVNNIASFNKRSVELHNEQQPMKKLKQTNGLHLKKTVEAKNAQHEESLKPDSIPLPASINAMFLERDKEIVHDDPSLHDGRIRSFAHEKNNWATYVYIDLQDCELGMV